MFKHIAIASTLGALTATSALAATNATAMTDLNLRTAPGPQAQIIDVIPGEAMVSVEQCADISQWCKVTYDGQEGWAYGAYLNAPMEGTAEPVVVYDNRDQLQIETVKVTDEENKLGGALAGGTAGAIAALAAAGGPATIAGAVAAGMFTGGALTPSEEKVVTYVRQNPAEPVYVQGEVVRGVAIPEEVELRAIPDSDYRYVYLNGVPAVVDGNRTVVTVVR
ncbi:DUF1236 domain-containing protein [Pseudooceanicola sp. LIPI14-2-Ac024]|uniref:DUF1236 domain-containing protein n=1 Tax=Pseudooceanicola sp. LIPI14-2-Ac024 TaxID=3344875 RepID=UPI0035CFD5BE